MKKTSHQQFAEELRQQANGQKRCGSSSRVCGSGQAETEDDELSEEELQRLLEQKFDELFGTSGEDE